MESAARADLGALFTGVARYRHHPYVRDLADPPAVWREGTTRLLDYRGLRHGPARGAAVLVPSLINRAHVLDLSSETSLVRRLAADGLDVFVVDWDAPGDTERRFGLADYVMRLARAVGTAAEAAGRPVGLVGYCMGGLLALPLAAGFAGPAAPVDRLSLLATPWDFQAGRAGQARALGLMGAAMAPSLGPGGLLPTDEVQALFAGLDPLLALRKFAAFARMAPQSARARAFVALEDWLNDGVPLAGPVASECLVGWYGENRPARGTWTLGGWTVDPGAVAVPAQAMIPAGDRIVPPASALALAGAIPGCAVARPEAGHIGMVVGRRAERAVARPLARFLAGGAADT